MEHARTWLCQRRPRDHPRADPSTLPYLDLPGACTPGGLLSQSRRAPAMSPVAHSSSPVVAPQEHSTAAGAEAADLIGQPTENRSGAMRGWAVWVRGSRDCAAQPYGEPSPRLV